MKKPILAIVFLFLACGVLSAQWEQVPEAVRYLKEDLSRAGTNIHPYEYFPSADTPAPKGYKPFYVSHYSRHGTRSTSDKGGYATLEKILREGRDAGILSAEGLAALKEVEYVDSCYNGMPGRLTARGVREHAEIAARLYKRVPAVFKKNARVRAISSTVTRSMVSMNSFTNSLAKMNPKLEFSYDAGEAYQRFLARSGNRDSCEVVFKAKRDSLRKAMPYDASYVVTRLFTDTDAAKKIIGNVREFNNLLFSVGEVAGNFDYEDTILPCISFDCIYSKWSRSNHYLYCYHCNSVEYGMKRMPYAEDLVKDIVTKADEAIAGGGYAADLRFGHDFPYLGLVSYLGIEGVGDRLSFDEVDAHWFASFHVCMACNLQMIFYRNKAGDVLVKFLCQEQECRLRGLEPVSGPYYRWSDVKADIKGYLR